MTDALKDTKYCPGCKKHKLLALFHTDKSKTTTGKSSQCMECNRKRKKNQQNIPKWLGD